MKSREPFRCNAEYPLKVTIRNLASKSITNVSFGLKAEIPHSSQDQLNAGEFSFPGIIEKGHEWTTCYRGKLENGVDPEEVIFIPRVYSAEYR